MVRVSGAPVRIFSHRVMICYTILLFVFMVCLMVLSLTRLELYYRLTAWMAGWFLWTLAEYLFNRWLLHLPESRFFFISIINRYHARHHVDPEDIRYSFMHPLMILVSTVVFFVLAFITLGKSALPLTSGLLFGYLLFILLHVSQHHYEAPSVRFLKGLWQNHFLHHHGYPDKAFGVSTTVWDYLFNSLPPRHLFFTVNPAVLQSGNPVLNAIEVGDKRSEEMFLDVPEAFFHRDPNWIPAIRSEISSIFNSLINPYLKHGDARRWIVVNKSGEVLGRIAAFINFKKMYDEDKKVGCIGFFECVNNREAAFLLFDTAIQWLVERYQVVAVDGPVNFGENDKYWGLLIKGFTPASYGMNYNPPYYQNFFETYGFKIQYKQLTSYVDLQKPLPERFNKIAEKVIGNKQYSFKPFRYRERESFINDFVLVYNQAWASFKNFHPMDVEVVRKSLDEMKPIMDENIIWFVYADNKAAGLLLAVPDVNEILKYAGGRFNWWGKCKLMFYKHWKGFSCLRVIVMGVVPDFQQRGLESGMIVHAYKEAMKNHHYKHVQLAWVGDFNDKMIAIHKAMGAAEDKQHATFRKVL